MRAAKPGWRIQPADEPLNSVNDNSPGSLAGHDLSDMPLPSAADDAGRRTRKSTAFLCIRISSPNYCATRRRWMRRRRLQRLATRGRAG